MRIDIEFLGPSRKSQGCFQKFESQLHVLLPAADFCNSKKDCFWPANLRCADVGEKCLYGQQNI